MPSLDNSHGVLLYSDGSAWTGDKSGGWGYVILDAFEGYLEGSGHVNPATNNQMELQGPAEGLLAILHDCGPSDVLVISDSEYVVFGFNDKTRKRNFNKSSWADLEDIASQHISVTFEHILGHSKGESIHNQFNERCDVLAGEARKNGQDRSVSK